MSQLTDLNWEANYHGIISDLGVIPLDGWTQVQITGSDRVKFLHNVCTNDVRRLEAGRMCEAFCTDVKGKILAHILVIAAEDHLVLLAVPGQAERLMAHLDRYVIREDVQLADVSQNCQWQYVVGPQAAGMAALERFSAKCDLLWPGGLLVQGEDGSEVSDSVKTVTVESPTFTALRVESFWALYGTDFDGGNLPQEINRDERAISFTKGCYLGQETVARIDALGHVNKKLVLVRFSGAEVPERGAKLFSGDNEVGIVTTGTWSPRFSAPVALAMVRRGFNETGTRLQCEGQDVEVLEAQ